jgi:hypothetical protein
VSRGRGLLEATLRGLIDPQLESLGLCFRHVSTMAVRPGEIKLPQRTAGTLRGGSGGTSYEPCALGALGANSYDVVGAATGQTTDNGSSFCPVGPIWMSVPISGQTPQS